MCVSFTLLVYFGSVIIADVCIVDTPSTHHSSNASHFCRNDTPTPRWKHCEKWERKKKRQNAADADVNGVDVSKILLSFNERRASSSEQTRPCLLNLIMCILLSALICICIHNLKDYKNRNDKNQQHPTALCIHLMMENSGYYIRFIKTQRMNYARFILFPFLAR